MGDLLYFIGENQTYSYVKYMLANSCMPTLLGVKPSCIISVNKKYIESKQEFIKFLETELNQFGCEYSIIYEEEQSYTLFLYHPEVMKKTLVKQVNKGILNYYGYDFNEDIVTNTILLLKVRYEAYKRKQSEFPHELGILLGYPVEDVIDYIKNDGKNYKFCGFWKVYHNVEEAEKIFEFFRLVREDALRIINSRKNLLEIKTIYKSLNEYALVC